MAVKGRVPQTSVVCSFSPLRNAVSRATVPADILGRRLRASSGATATTEKSRPPGGAERLGRLRCFECHHCNSCSANGNPCSHHIDGKRQQLRSRCTGNSVPLPIGLNPLLGLDLTGEAHHGLVGAVVGSISLKTTKRSPAQFDDQTAAIASVTGSEIGHLDCRRPDMEIGVAHPAAASPQTGKSGSPAGLGSFCRSGCCRGCPGDCSCATWRRRSPPAS